MSGRIVRVKGWGREWGALGGVEAFKGWCFVAVGKARCAFLSALRSAEVYLS